MVHRNRTTDGAMMTVMTVLFLLSLLSSTVRSAPLTRTSDLCTKLLDRHRLDLVHLCQAILYRKSLPSISASDLYGKNFVQFEIVVRFYNSDAVYTYRIFYDRSHWFTIADTATYSRDTAPTKLSFVCCLGRPFTKSLLM